MKVQQKYNDNTLNVVFDTIVKKKQALVFVNSKRSAEKTAEDIAAKIKEKNIELEELAEKVENVLPRPTKQCERLGKCLRKGIAFHHAGLRSEQKTLIEDAFRDGKVKVICCTPTLCLSKDSMIWHGVSESMVDKLDVSNPLFVLSNNKLITMKPQKVQQIANSSNLIQITSVSGYSIKVTPNHKMLIKRDGKRLVLQAGLLKKDDKVATIGKLNLSNDINPLVKDFVTDNICNLDQGFDDLFSYLIGVMLGDGYSGAETSANRIMYKGSPAIVGIDDEIFLKVKEACRKLGLSFRETKTQGGTPQLVLGKNKWFREFLVRCGVEKKDRKHISDKLMRMDLENVSWLLRGLFDTDGYVQKGKNVGFTNTSEGLVKQMQKLLLRFGIVSRIRRRKVGSMKIYEKEYATMPYLELTICQKKSILDFYRFIGFNIIRKQDVLINLVSKICSNLNFVSCVNCRYRVYADVFSGRTKEQKRWGQLKFQVLKFLGEKGELGSRELKRLLGTEPKKKDSRLNHHYEFIKKRRLGNRSNTEWFWSFNPIGKWIFEHLVYKDKNIFEFFKLEKCPLCGKELEWTLKKGWRDSDFDADVFWDKIRGLKEVECEKEVYDVVLSANPKNNHMFVANGFIVHNSAGVDLPAFRTVLKSLRRYGGFGLSWIPVLEYLQMSGRAGRPGKEDYGESIAIAASEAERDEIHERFILGEPEEIYSKLAVEPVLRTYLLSLIASEFVKTKEQIMDFFSRTFWAYQFKDMDKLQSIIERMLGLLEKWEFIVGKGLSDFMSADEARDGKYEATILGKRVAELYIDPLTANYIAESLKRAKNRFVKDFSFLQMICDTIEMRPLLRVKVKEFEDIQARLVEYDNMLLDIEPALYEPEYDDFLNSVKTALFMQEWIDEADEETLLEKYDIRPGEIRVKLDNADWLLYAAYELARILQMQDMLKELSKVRMRLKYGVKEELLALLKFEGIGRVRARKLWNNKIRDVKSIKETDYSVLSSLIGSKVAASLKEQVGEKVEAVKVKEGKRKGQISLRDF